MAKSVRDNIVSLFSQDDEDLAPVPIEGLRQVVGDGREIAPTTGIDLSSRHKVIMPLAPGRAGKTLLCRWMIERAVARGERPSLATMDQGRPALRLYFPEAAVVEPRQLFSKLMKSPRTLVLDMGADMTLAPVLSQLPSLHDAMETSGLSPVLLYLLTPRQLDLTVLDAMEALKFQPPATALLLNTGLLDDADKAESAFRLVRRHPTYKAALDRGAVEVWVPKLYPSKTIEDRQLSLFRAAEPHVLDIFDERGARTWLDLMEREFAGVGSWLP